MGTNSQDDPEETRYGGLDKELKDDINKETTAAGSAHGHLDLHNNQTLQSEGLIVDLIVV
jgi:hypothetical protein